MHNIKEFEAHSNKMSDQIAGALVFACFLNPTIEKISFGYNYLRGCFAKTLSKTKIVRTIKLMTSIRGPGMIGHGVALEKLGEISDYHGKSIEGPGDNFLSGIN